MATHAHSTPTLARENPPSRRLILSAFTGAAFAGMAVVPAPADAAENPDAELLATLAEFDRLEREIWPPGVRGPDTIAGEEERDVWIAPLQERQAELLDRICVLHAHTPQGHRARARSILLWDKELQKAIAAGDDAKSYDDDRMIRALIRDLVGSDVT